MSQVNPYLKFNDSKCREAMTFYKECLGGELDLKTVGESGMPEEMKMDKDKIMHGSLIGDGIEFYASDMMRDQAVIGDNVALCINCPDEARARDMFSKLAVGGSVFMPLEKQFWGDLFGTLTDKYGVEWMVNCHPQQ